MYGKHDDIVSYFASFNRFYVASLNLMQGPGQSLLLCAKNCSRHSGHC